MSDDILSIAGRNVGRWNGENVQDLQQELERISQELSSEGSGERLSPKDMPHRDRLPEDLRTFKAYPIWGYDKHANCLCGARANRVVSAEDVRQYSLVDHH